MKSKHVKVIAVIFSILGGLYFISYFGYSIVNGYYSNLINVLISFISIGLPYVIGSFILFALSAVFKNHEEIASKLSIDKATTDDDILLDDTKIQ